MSETNEALAAAGYRAPGWDGAELRREAVVAVERVLSEPDVSGVLATRYARSMLGRWLTFAALLLPFTTIPSQGYSAVWLLWSSLLAPLVYFGAKKFGAGRAKKLALSQAEKTLEAQSIDPSWQERWLTPQGIERSLSGTLTGAGRPTSWLLAGGALFLPLWIHGLVALVSQRGMVGASGFDTWVQLSALIVGHCHLVLAGLGWRHGNRVETLTETELGSPAIAGWKALGWTVLASTMPGLFLLGVPVVLVALTGLVLPFLWSRVTKTAWNERRTLHEAVTRQVEPLRVRVSLPAPAMVGASPELGVEEKNQQAVSQVL